VSRSRKKWAASQTAAAPIPAPPWLVVVAATAAFAVLFAFGFSPRTALYWYIFPLFGVGSCYLVQFRSEFPSRWKVTFAATAVLSVVALALDWPFSGHVLWNVLFIGHAWRAAKRRTAWIVLLFASLLYLIVMKIAFQTSRDVAGAGISVAVAAIALLTLKDRTTSCSSD
jgi:hypothetical protein